MSTTITRFIAFFILLVLGNAFFYGLGAFVSADLALTGWEGGTRWLVALCSFCWVVVCFVALANLLGKDSK